MNITGVSEVLTAFLKEQGKTDFQPKELGTQCTKTCVGCVQYLKQVWETAKKALGGRNLESFMRKVSLDFHDRLVIQIQSFNVNTFGGLAWVKYVLRESRRRFEIDIGTLVSMLH